MKYTRAVHEKFFRFGYDLESMSDDEYTGIIEQLSDDDSTRAEAAFTAGQEFKKLARDIECVGKQPDGPEGMRLGGWCGMRWLKCGT